MNEKYLNLIGSFFLSILLEAAPPSCSSPRVIAGKPSSYSVSIPRIVTRHCPLRSNGGSTTHDTSTTCRTVRCAAGATAPRVRSASMVVEVDRKRSARS
jgi:hypothetical protein